MLGIPQAQLPRDAGSLQRFVQTFFSIAAAQLQKATWQPLIEIVLVLISI